MTIKQTNTYSKTTRLQRYIKNEDAYDNLIKIYKELKKENDKDLLNFFKCTIYCSFNPKNNDWNWVSPTEYALVLDMEKIILQYNWHKIKGYNSFGHNTQDVKLHII